VRLRQSYVRIAKRAAMMAGVCHATPRKLHQRVFHIDDRVKP
jgi:hypothetical protein